MISDWGNGLRNALWISALLLIYSDVARAQPRRTARERFAEGINLVKEGDLDAAVDEFEGAYRISPNFAVLYNLGQAYLALNKPVEAIDAFVNYLKLGGEKITATRHREVEDLISTARKRVGDVSFAITPMTGKLLIDGQPPRASGPISLRKGIHGISVTGPGYLPFVGRVDVQGGERKTVQIELQPLPTSVTAAAVGQLMVSCPIPTTEVILDRTIHVKVTNEPLLIPVGRHELTCSREGYVTESHAIQVDSSDVTHVTCDLRQSAAPLVERTGLVTLRLEPVHSEVSIDGHLGKRMIRLPVGPHVLVARYPRFEEFRTTIIVHGGSPEILQIHLRPTPKYAKERGDATRRRRGWAYVIGGSGLTLLGIGAAIFINDNARYDAWKRDSGVLSQAVATQPWSPTLSQRESDLQSRAATIQRRDDISLGIAAIGVALIADAIGSLLVANQE